MDAADRRRLADNLRYLRSQKRLSLQKLSNAAGLDRHTLSALERCEEEPLRETLDALARALGVHPEELLGLPVQRELLPNAAEVKMDLVKRILALPDDRAARLHPVLLQLLERGELPPPRARKEAGR